MEKTEKKRKWERDYEQYSSSTELDERIQNLQDLINGKTATKEEYAEHKKLTAVKSNLPKVKNILELREKLDLRRKAIRDEIARRESIEKYEKATKVLDNEMKRLQWEKDLLEEQLKNPNLKPEKRAEFETKLAENDKKRQENNMKFGDCHEAIKAQNSQTEQSEFKNVSIEDLKNRAISISSHISQCNLACNKLMQGFSWQSIEVALDKYEGEKLKAKGQQAAKIKQNREAAKASNAKGQQTTSAPKSQDKEENEENSLVPLTRWQKIKNWAKETWGKIKAPFVDDEEQEVSEEVESEQEEKPTFWQRVKNWFKDDESKEQSEKGKENSEKGKEDSFRQYLRDVAEKGMDGVEQEKTEARMKSAREKLEANRAEALKRETERDQKNKDAR